MSRVAKAKIQVSKGAKVLLGTSDCTVKGPLGEMTCQIHPLVDVVNEEGALKVFPKEASRTAWAFAGTVRANISNMVIGVTDGFVKELELVGVGYRAQLETGKLNLSLGFSHPVNYQLPPEVSAEVPSPTVIRLKSYDKQVLGRVAAEIVSFRPPEPYKGKGVRYKGQLVRLKDRKKK